MQRRTDSKTVKALWSIVVGLAMIVGGQPGAVGAPVSGCEPMLACKGCTCAELSCCGTTSPSTPPSIPTASDLRVQAPAFFVVTLLATPPEAVCASVFFSCDRSLSSRAVIPVYDRNCSYLI